MRSNQRSYLNSHPWLRFIANIHTMTPELAILYASKTGKTVIRDVNELEQMGLIVKTADRKIAVNVQKLMSFLPGRKIPTSSVLEPR